MNDIPQFSIIVPVYKAEVFIAQCIEGMLAQTITDFELILVNDGSPDRSGEICEEYAKKDKRVRVYHKDNGGPSSARNLGLDNATGEIICFVDSDDYVAPEYLENFGDCNADIIIQGYYARKNCKEYNYCSIKEGVFQKNNIIDLMDTVHIAKNTGYLWARAFKRQIIEANNLRLNVKYHIREDEEFIGRYMCKCQTFETIDKGAYYYDMPDFTSKYSFIELGTDIECTISIIEHVASLLGNYDHPYIVNNINRLASNSLNSYRRKIYNIAQTKEYIDVFRKYYKKVKVINALSIKSKLLYYLIGNHTPNFLHMIYHYFLSK